MLFLRKENERNDGFGFVKCCMNCILILFYSSLVLYFCGKIIFSLIYN